MSAHPRIRFSTNLITFFNTARAGLGADIPYTEWQSAFEGDLRGYFDSMLDGARDAGVEGVELAPDPGGWPNAETAYGGAAGFGHALSDRGLQLSSSYAPGRRLIGEVFAEPSRQKSLDDWFDRHAEFTANLGASIITMGNLARSRFGNESPDGTATAQDFSAPVDADLLARFADQLNHLGAITSRHGVRIAVHTDAYSICSRSEDIDIVMASTDPRLVALCPDAGHITLDGGDPVEILRRHIDRIPTMHWKDCLGPLSGHLLRGVQKERHKTMLKYFRILGSGSVDWRAWMQVLRENDWSGWAIEEIDMSPDPVDELRIGLDFFRTELAPLYPVP